jgi:prepilin-type N-terminal cleavage/methylation domain-containing protein/prepilin-type processing-associated H-X9-DG protein
MLRFTQHDNRASVPARTRQTPARGFTLVELLVVILILAVLVALLAPGARNAWDTAHMTQCQANLARIFAAHGVWRADYDGRILAGASWMGSLLPYVDHEPSVFRCRTQDALRAGWGDGVQVSMAADEAFNASDGGYGGTSGAGGTTGTSGDDSSDDWTPSTYEVDAAFEFDIYWQRPEGSLNRGEFGYSIPLGSHPWVKRTDKGDYVYYQIDDAGSSGGKNQATFDDIELYVYYNSEGLPTSVKVMAAKPSGSNQSRFIFDFKAFGQIVVSDWVRHYGETYSLDGGGNDGPGGGGGSGGMTGTGGYGAEGGIGGWEYTSDGWRPRSHLPIIFGDYAMSRGSYDTGSRLVSIPDAKLFFVIDYAYGRTVADYNGSGNDDDEWDKYFIEDPVRWKRDWSDASGTWHQYQALRHFGRANVLFCDGHIECLGPDELRPNDERWRYRGH